MNTLIKTDDLRIAYKVTIWLLLSNNIAGIALNPLYFLLSLMFLIGIPGLIFLVFYIFSLLNRLPSLVFMVHISALLYNIIIYHALGNIIKNTGEEIIGGTIWPELNIILSGMASIICLIHFFFKSPYNHEN